MAGRDAPQGWLDRNAVTGIGTSALVLVLICGGLSAEDGQPLPPTNTVVAQAAGQQAEPDVFGRVTRWFDRAVHDVSDSLKNAFGGVGQVGDRTRDVIKGAARDMSNTAGSLAVLPDIRIVDERVVCPPAANRAPDCRRAAEAVCRRRGFRSGRILETRSEEKCSFRALLARRTGQPNTCRREAYVLRSICR